MNLSKIKVLVLTSSFPRYKDDWWQRAVLSIYSNMDLKKVDVTVISPSGPGAVSEEDINGIHVKRFAYFFPTPLQLLTSGEGILYTSKRNRILGRIQVVTFIWAEFYAVIKALMLEKYNVIHANWILPQGLVAVIAKFIFKKPVIVTVHGTDIFALRKANFLKAFILKYSDICTANSSATFAEVKKIYQESNVKIVHMGVDLDVFSKDKRDDNFRKGFGKNPKIILGVGRLIKWKGFEYLIRAFPLILSKFPQVKLIIIGKGPEQENLMKLAVKLKLEIDKNIFFMGTVDPQKLPVIYASCDVAVTPSITNAKTGEREGQGNVVMEAMASGTPVVASRSGGIVDMIDGYSTGFLFEEKDYKSLSEKIIAILSKRAVRDRLTENGLKLTRSKYPWGRTSQKFVKIYESLVFKT